MTQTDGSSPQTLPFVTEARAHLQAGDGAGALAVLDGAGDDRVDSDPQALLLRSQAQLMVGETNKAARALGHAARAGLPVETVERHYRQFDPKALSRAPDVHVLGWLMDRIEDFDLVLRLAHGQLRLRRFDQAEKSARRARKMNPSNPMTHRLLYLAVLRSDRPERVPEVIRAALDSPSANPRFPALMMTLAGMENDDRETLTQAVADRWPNALSSGRHSGDLSVRAGGSLAEAASDRAYDRAYELALRGETEAALALAEKVQQDDDGDDPSARKETIADVIRAIPTPDMRQRPLLEDDGSEVVRSAPSMNGVTMLAFTDLVHQLDYQHRVIDAFCARTGAASLFLSDRSYRLFIGGVGTLASDREGTVAALREELAALGTRKLVVMGQSSGGFSAVHYGCDLGAAAVHGFSIPTSIDRFLSGADTRARMLIGKLRRTFPPEALDLAKIVPTYEAPPPIDLYFGADQDNDRGHAQDIAHLPTVSLHALDGHGHHQVLPRLIPGGRFQRFLEG